MDALLAIVLERTAHGVGDHTPRKTQRQAHGARIRQGGLERLDGKLQQGTSPLAEGIRRVVGQHSIALDLHAHHSGAMLGESARLQLHGQHALERHQEGARPQQRTKGHRSPPRKDVLHRRRQDFHGLVDRGLRCIITWIHAKRPLARRQQDQAAPEGPVSQDVTPVGARHVEGQHHTQSTHPLDQLGVARLEPLEGRTRHRPRPPDLLEVESVHGGHEAQHAHGVALPGGVEFLLLLEKHRQGLAHEKHAVLRLLRPGDDVGRRRKVEMLMRPHQPGRAETRLHLVEDERHLVDQREQAQAPKEAAARHPDAPLTLHGLHDHRRHAQGAPELGRPEALPLHCNEGLKPSGDVPRQERVHPPQRLAKALPAPLENLPDLPQAAFLAALRRAR